MNFVDEEYIRDNFSFVFFFLFVNFGVDLVVDFIVDFIGVVGEKGEEILCLGIDDIDFVKGDGVDDFFVFLEFFIRVL